MENSSHRKRQVVAGGTLGRESSQASARGVSGVDTTPTSPDLGASSCGGRSTGMDLNPSWLSVEAPGTLH